MPRMVKMAEWCRFAQDRSDRAAIALAMVLSQVRSWAGVMVAWRKPMSSFALVTSRRRRPAWSRVMDLACRHERDHVHDDVIHFPDLVTPLEVCV